jgi:hypothetical protein
MLSRQKFITLMAIATLALGGGLTVQAQPAPVTLLNVS